MTGTRRHRRLRAAALVACAALAACARERRPPNLVLISIDTLRPDHLGAYGYSRDTSPELDRLAREGVVFERAYSTSNWTLPSHVSMLTGLYPAEHGVLRLEQAIGPGVEMLPEALGRLGYRSAGIVSTVAFLTARHGFARGWGVYDDRTAYAADRARSALHVSSEQVVARVRSLLDDELGSGPFFLFAHFYDVHTEYRPPPPFDTMFRPASGGAAGRLEPGVPGAWAARTDAARYDGEIRWVDGRLGELFAELDRRGLGETTLVLVTADHGEEFLEHGERTHGKNFYDTSLRVPMILRLPGGAHAGRRIATPVSLVDVGATLVAAAGGGASTWHSGRDLAGLLGAAPDRAWRERELYATGKARGGGLLTALIADGRKVVVRADREGRPRREALTVTAPQRDPGEKSLEPLRARETARWRRRLLAAWDAQRATARPPAAAAPADAEERAALRALGYL